jgi:hypothetical protein
VTRLTFLVLAVSFKATRWFSEVGRVIFWTGLSGFGVVYKAFLGLSGCR